ncbi:flavin monoamine oxidase family protein [Altererythrobacter sp. GH1-8]|uniref:flavin monoamine oxidase family protein n=1 Tax=Altererythrobacter sp. GH1-8 TaxID=3349333 RepID=UPI00374D41AB
MPRPARASQKFDVIVIGAGLSGLHAANLLHDQGYKVKVLEGKSRVGGRVETAYGLETRPELGASQIGRAYARVIAACDRFGLTLIPEDRDLLTFCSNLDGQWIKADQWQSSPLNPFSQGDRDIPPLMAGPRLLDRLNPLEELTDWLDPKFAHLDISARQLFEQHGYSEEVIRLAGLNVLANDIDSASCLTMMQEQHRGRWSIKNFSNADAVTDAPYGFQEIGESAPENLAIISNIKEGAEALPKAMAAHLDEGSIELNKIVMKIDMFGPVAEVQTLDGAKYQADFVISAVPFTTLRRIGIEPGLPPIQAKAVHELGYSNTSRAHLVIREPFWKEDGLDPSFFSDGAIKMFWAVDNHTGEGEHVGYLVMTGDSASRMDMMPREDASRFLMEELARVRPASAGKVELLTYKSWENDPLIRGVRHSFAPGQVTAFANEMIQPHGRLHFAGEHTRRTELGMEAAMESGERVAIEIISASS